MVNCEYQYSQPSLLAFHPLIRPSRLWYGGSEFFHDLQDALRVQSSGRDLTEKSMANFTATCYITNKNSWENTIFLSIHLFIDLCLAPFNQPNSPLEPARNGQGNHLLCSSYLLISSWNLQQLCKHHTVSCKWTTFFEIPSSQPNPGIKNLRPGLCHPSAIFNQPNRPPRQQLKSVGLRVGFSQVLRLHESRFKKCHTSGWKKSCTSWYGKFPVIYMVLYIPDNAGFLR